MKLYLKTLCAIGLCFQAITCEATCISELQDDSSGNSRAAAEASAIKELEFDDQLEIENLASNSNALFRSHTNTTSVASTYDSKRIPSDDTFKEILDVTDLFQVKRKHSEEFGGQTEEWETESHLNKDYASIDRDMNAPILDSAEIRSRQEMHQELLKNPTLAAQLKKWTTAHSQMHERDNFFYDVRNMRFESPMRGDDPKIARTRNLALLKAIARLPEDMAQASASLKGAESKRLRQLEWLAKQSSENPAFVETCREIQKIVEKEDSNISEEELSHAMQIASGLRRMPTFKNDILFIGESLNATAALHDFVVAKGWSHFPTVLNRDTQVGPILEIEGGHAPRVLSEKGEGSISNKVAVGGSNPSTLIVTGPNAKGKSTYLRMAAQNLLIAQLGLPVPSTEMRFTPMSIYFHLNPKDAPSQNMSLFVKQSQELKDKVYSRVNADPFQLIILDEILPGTIAPIRTAAETVFLRRLTEKKPITLVATHNWGTTSLEAENPSKIRNLHVDQYHVLPGAQQDYSAMVNGAAEALHAAGWTEAEIADFRKEAEKNQPQ